jgi:metallo-beta-lactamase family protein
MQYFRPVEFGKTVELRPDFSFRFVRAAHILGSSMVEIGLGANGNSQRLLFTGDIGRVRDSEIAPGRVVHNGPNEGEAADVLVMESTYGNRLHPKNDPRPELARLVRETTERGGCVVIPAFAVERTQKLLFMLKALMLAGDIPKVPVHTDSPMAIEAVKIFLKYAGEFSEETRQLIAKCGSPLTWENFYFDTTTEQSKKINDSHFPMIIVSSSGMATGGRILHHLAQRLPDPKNLVLFIGFQSPGTRGFAIKNGAREVKMFGQTIPVRAQVTALEQFSDHADTPELLEWLHTFKQSPSRTYLVHGEPAAAAALRQSMVQALGWHVEAAQYMQKVSVGAAHGALP